MEYNKVEFGDCRETMRKWKTEGVQVQTTITSPPYYGLRDYGKDGQIGREDSPQKFIDELVEVFNCVRDITAEDGTCWVNLGDTYMHGGIGGNNNTLTPNKKVINTPIGVKRPANIKDKDLIGIPWMFALAARESGWYLRQDIIWSKPNPMPESVTDRCTKSHEYIFLLAKNPSYYYDNGSIKSNTKTQHDRVIDTSKGKLNKTPGKTKSGGLTHNNYAEKNERSVWHVNSQPYEGAHFACYPERLIIPMVLSSTKEGDVVFDPFMGSGTTAQVAKYLKRQYLGCELNESYGALQQERINGYGGNDSLYESFVGKDPVQAYKDIRNAEDETDEPEEVAGGLDAMMG